MQIPLVSGGGSGNYVLAAQMGAVTELQVYLKQKKKPTEKDDTE